MNPRERARTRTIGTAFAALWAGTLVVFVCKTVADTTTPAFAVDLGSTLAEAGWQTSAFFIVSIIARFIFGPLADLLGKRQLMVAGQAMLAVGALMLAAAEEMPLIVASRAVQACGIAAFYPAAMALATTLAPDERRGTYLGVFRLAVALPMMFGPALFLEAAARIGWQLCFTGLFLLLCASLVVTRIGIPVPSGAAAPSAPEDSVRIAEIARSYKLVLASGSTSFWLALVLSFISTAGFAVITGFTAVLFSQGLVQGQPGLFFLAFGIGALAGGPAAGILSDRRGIALGLAATFLIESAGLVLFACGSATPGIVYGAGALVGLGKSGAAVAIADLTSRAVSERNRTLALALQQSCGDAGSACSTALFGAIFGALGFPPLAVVAFGAVTLLFGAISLVLVPKGC